EVEAAQPALAGLAAEEQAAVARAREASEWVGRLQSIAVPAAVRAFAEDHRAARAALEAAAATLAEAGARRKAAATERERLPDLGTLRAVRAAHEALAECQAATARAEAARAEQAAGEARLRAEKEAAGLAVRAAAEALGALQRRHLAHALAATLVAGEPCPVCDHVVERLPHREPVGALADAERRVADAETAFTAAQHDHATAEKRLAGTTAQLETLAAQRATLAVRVESHPDVGELDVLIKRVVAAEAGVQEAQAGEDEARERAEAAKEILGRLEGAAQTARRDFTAQRDKVVALGPPGSGDGDVLAEWEALAAWAAALVPTQQSAVAAAQAEAAGHAAARREILSGLHRRFGELGLAASGGADGMALVSAAATAVSEAAHAVEEIEEAIGQAAKLRESRAGLEDDAQVARLLGQLLRADRFPEWLVAEALAVLTVDASEILRELTGSQYSLAVGEKEFVVVDHANADEQRPARTLSGGETFQASLALALALSQQIRNLAAEGAPRLDAIFLDEGFGTLDPETLDVVAATIENLGQGGRMVGVVTHVAELAARVPVRFEVRKGRGTSVIEKKYA